MQRRPQIPDAVRLRIDGLLERSAGFFKQGQLDEALRLAHEAWDLIPEPKATWDYYPQSLAVAFVEDYADQEDLEKAKKWIEVCYQVYDDPDRVSHYILMLEGSTLYKLGLEHEAYGVFSKLRDLFGRGGFKGEHREYLKFLEKYRTR